MLTSSSENPLSTQFLTFSFMKRLIAADREFYNTVNSVIDDSMQKISMQLNQGQVPVMQTFETATQSVIPQQMMYRPPPQQY